MIRRLALALALAGALIGPVAAAPVIQVTSPGGIEAWLIESHAAPLLSISFGFRGGVAEDPAGKGGLANFAMDLLDEGAGDLDSQAFQTALGDNAIELSFQAYRDSLDGSLKTLTDRREKAVEMLRAALLEPRFDPEPVERVRASLLSRMKRESVDPNAIGDRVLLATLFPGHPYGRPAHGTAESLGRLTIDDLRAFARQRLTRERLLVAVAGDVTPSELGPILDRAFGALPATGPSTPVADVAPSGSGRTILVPRPIPQTIMVMAGEGVARRDPDWYAAFVMNHILGGGGFSSRLMDEVREKRGLTYGVSSQLAPSLHAALIYVGASTKNQNAGEALDLIRSEWRRMADGGVTEEELESAKAYLTGSLALRLTSTTAIAQTLLQLRFDGLPPDYLERREGYFAAVTRADVARVAKRLLDPARLLTVLVGRPDKVSPTETMDQPPG